MSNPIDIAGIEKCLQTYADRPEFSYITRMWQFALSAHSDGQQISNERCDAIPYLPLGKYQSALDLDGDSRIVDIGCLGGYGLFDIAARCRQSGKPLPEMIGVDIDPNSIHLAKQLAPFWAKGINHSFVEGQLMRLPATLGHADVVICRLVLPYTTVKESFENMANILKNNGVLVLQVHSPSYYGRQLRENIKDLRKVAYYVRPLLCGILFHVTGYQMHGKYMKETALTRSTILQLAKQNHLQLIETIGFNLKPVYIFKRTV